MISPIFPSFFLNFFVILPSDFWKSFGIFWRTKPPRRNPHQLQGIVCKIRNHHLQTLQIISPQILHRIPFTKDLPLTKSSHTSNKKQPTTKNPDFQLSLLFSATRIAALPGSFCSPSKPGSNGLRQ